MLQGKKLFVFEAGQTNGAHRYIVEKLRDFGQKEVNTLQECDFLLVFCPVVSRVGTDIAEALNSIPRGKRVILVVMHPTFSPHHVVAESRRHVQDPTVRLTVDCLFHQGKLLNCNLNDRMFDEFQRILEVSVIQVIFWKTVKYLKNPLVVGCMGAAFMIYYFRHGIRKQIGL